MNYEEVVEQINKIKKRNCFKKPEQAEVGYLTTFKLSDDILQFYKDYNPIDLIEINGVRLLPISEISEENSNYTPGYLLSPLGYCVVATTINGDVYCIRNITSSYTVVIASHDEIFEGQTPEEMVNETKKTSDDFLSFLKSFTENKLVTSFYDLEA